MPTPLRAVLYACIGNLQHSAESQLAMCRDHATVNGWSVVGEFVDVRLTSAHADKPAYEHMLETVRAGRADIVVAYDMSRLARNLDEAAELIRDGIRLGLIA